MPEFEPPRARRPAPAARRRPHHGVARRAHGRLPRALRARRGDEPVPVRLSRRPDAPAAARRNRSPSTVAALRTAARSHRSDRRRGSGPDRCAEQPGPSASHQPRSAPACAPRANDRPRATGALNARLPGPLARARCGLRAGGSGSCSTPSPSGSTCRRGRSSRPQGRAHDRRSRRRRSVAPRSPGRGPPVSIRSSDRRSEGERLAPACSFVFLTRKFTCYPPQVDPLQKS